MKIGYKKRRFCFCVRRCYGDETENDNQQLIMSDEYPAEDGMDELEDNIEDESDAGKSEQRTAMLSTNSNTVCSY